MTSLQYNYISQQFPLFLEKDPGNCFLKNSPGSPCTACFRGTGNVPHQRSTLPVPFITVPSYLTVRSDQEAVFHCVFERPHAVERVALHFEEMLFRIREDAGGKDSVAVIDENLD